MAARAAFLRACAELFSGAAPLVAAGSVQAEEKVPSASDQSALFWKPPLFRQSKRPSQSATLLQSEPVSQDKLPLEVSHAEMDQALAEAEKAGSSAKAGAALLI